MRVVSLSPLGDFCVVAGLQFVSIWTQDSGFESYTQQVLYSKRDFSNSQIGQIVEEEESLTGEVVCASVCGEGRLIATLE